MSIDLNIWSSKQLPKNNSLLIENGYQDKNDCYVREENDWTVCIRCNKIQNSNDIPVEIAQMIPNVSYLTEVIFSGNVPEKILDEASLLCETLAKDMNGVVEDPQAMTIVTPTGMKQNMHGKQYDVFFEKIQRKIKKAPKEMLVLIVSLALLAMAMFAFIMIFIFINPAKKPFDELVPVILMCSVLFVACILLIIYTARMRKNLLNSGVKKSLKNRPELESVGIVRSANDYDTNDNADKNYDANMEEAAQFNYDLNKRRFDFKDEQSDKFWNINMIGEYYYVHYGRNGTFGRIDIKESDSAEDCEKFVKKTINEKLNKGYMELVAVEYSDSFEKHKATCRSVLDSMHFMFKDETPLIYMAAVKSACEIFCDLLRKTAGNEEKTLQCVKSLVLCLNQLTEETGIIETEERERLCEFINEGIKLAGMNLEKDVTEDWREW